MSSLNNMERRIFLRVLRWKIQLRSLETVQIVLYVVAFIAALSLVICWMVFGFLAILPYLADAMPTLLALAGIIMSYKPPKKETHHVATIALITFGLMGTLILTAARRKGETDHKKEIDGLNRKLDTVGTQNTHLANMLIEAKGKMTEAQRRAGIETSLRNKYILSHDPIDPEILAGNKMPPADWVNDQLKGLGEKWAVAPQPVQPAAVPVRSYLAFENNSVRFTGSVGLVPGTIQEGLNFRAGDGMAFNVHYKSNGPDPIQVGLSMSRLLFEPDSTPAIQRSATSLFLQESAANRQMWQKAHPKESEFQDTLMPGDVRFMTAFPWKGGQRDMTQRFTQEDLDKLKTGAEVAFVLTVIPYKDHGVLHHLRQCVILQPPAQSPGVLAYCEGFPLSD